MLGWHQSTGSDETSGLGGDGRYDPPQTWITFGVIVPLALLVCCCFIIWTGGITLSGENSVTWRFQGFRFVVSSVMAIAGVAVLLFANYFLPNVFRRSYIYENFAFVGLILAVVGGVWFVVAGFIG